MIAIHAQTERKRLDRSVRCAEKRRPWARKQRLRGLIRPDPAVCATAGAACGRKSLSSDRIQAIFTSNDTPPGECRLNPFREFLSIKLDRACRQARDPIKAMVLMAAMDGLMFQHLLKLPPAEPEIREKILERIEEMLAQLEIRT